MTNPSWSLVHLNPRQPGLRRALPRWFSHLGPRIGCKVAKRTRRAELDRFIQLDSESPSAGKWRSRLARRLLGLHVHMRRTASRWAEERGRDDEGLNLWLMSHCPPSGGLWKCEVPKEEHQGLTGKLCHSRLCPWCWLRQFGEIYRLASSAVTEHQGKTRTGLSLPPKINYVKYICRSPTVLETDRGYRQFRAWCRSAVGRRWVKPTDGDPRQEDLPECGKSMVLTQTHFTSEGRPSDLCVAYHYADSSPEGTDEFDVPTRFGPVTVLREKGIDLEATLMWHCAYPAHLLEGTAEAALLAVRSVKGRHAWDIFQPASPASPASPTPSEVLAASA